MNREEERLLAQAREQLDLIPGAVRIALRRGEWDLAKSLTRPLANVAIEELRKDGAREKNLWVETLASLYLNGVTPEQVLFVSTSHGTVPWEVFEARARGFDYNSGYGREEVRTDLKVVGLGWWLQRADYDGSEWWTFHKSPTQTEPSTLNNSSDES